MENASLNTNYNVKAGFIGAQSGLHCTLFCLESKA